MQNLLAKYAQLTDLRDGEAEVLANLANARRSYRAGHTIVASELEDPDQLYIVSQGRLFASYDLPNGRRAITRLYFPGDIVGTANIPFEHATHNIVANTDVDVFIFPRRDLVKAFEDNPRIAAAFYTFAALESAVLNDRLVSIGRTPGRARLAALLLEIASREHLTDHGPFTSCRPCLTQEQIGDAIGLTVVQVSRLFRDLTDEGLIRRQNSHVEFHDVAKLHEIGHFENRYRDLDLDWYEEDKDDLRKE